MKKSLLILVQVALCSMATMACQTTSKSSGVSADQGLGALTPNIVPVSEPQAVTQSCDALAVCPSSFHDSDVGCVLSGPRLEIKSFIGGNNCSDALVLLEKACAGGRKLSTLKLQCYHKADEAITLPAGAVPVSEPVAVEERCDSIPACPSSFSHSDLGCVLRGPRLLISSFKGGNNCSDSQALLEQACEGGRDLSQLTMQCYISQQISKVITDAKSVRLARADLRKNAKGKFLTGVGGTETNAHIAINVRSLAEFEQLKTSALLFEIHDGAPYYRFNGNLYVVKPNVVGEIRPAGN